LLLPLQTSVENGSKAILLTGEVAHFQRLIPLMTAELQGIESDMAEVAQESDCYFACIQKMNSGIYRKKWTILTLITRDLRSRCGNSWLT